MISSIFAEFSRQRANVSNFMFWQTWSCALLLCLVILPSVAAPNISDAEVGSYVVRDGVIQVGGLFPNGLNGHAGLASRIDDANNYWVLDIEGPGDTVRERLFTAFLTTKSTGHINSLMGVGDTQQLASLSFAKRQAYRLEIRAQAARAIGRPYVLNKDMLNATDFALLWEPPFWSLDALEQTRVSSGVPVVAEKYRCDGLVEWSYEAALVKLGVSPNSLGYVNPSNGMYPINYGNILFGGVSPREIYTRDSLPNPQKTSIVVKSPEWATAPNYLPPDSPFWVLPVSPNLVGGSYSMSWAADDESGIKEYRYGWSLDGAHVVPATDLFWTTSTSVSNLDLPYTPGRYRFLVYAEDWMGHWTDDTQRHPSSVYSIPPVFNFPIGSTVHVNSSIGVNVRSIPGGADVAPGEKDGAYGTIMSAPQWAWLASASTYYLWWDISWSDGRRGWSAGDSLVAGPPPATASVPVISSNGTVPAVVGTAFSYAISATNKPSSYSASPLPSGLTINPSTGVISGTPTTPGTTVVTLGATNSAGPASGGISIVVTAVPVTINPPAVSSGLSLSGTVGSLFSYQVVASNSPTSYTATGLPPGLSINTGSGVISGTPTAAGSYTVSLSATNGGGTGTGMLTITTASVYQGSGEILAVNPGDGALNQPLSVTLSWSASNPGGGTLHYDVYVVQAATDNYFQNNIVSQGQTATSFTVSNLPYNTPVSWGVKATDSATGAVRYSRMFHFSTAAFTTASTGSVSINAGAATTTSYSVILNITVNSVANGVRQYMRFSNDGVTYGDWRDVSSMFPWNLADSSYGGRTGLTTYTVYAKFRDDQGHESPVYTDTITKVAGTAGNIILNGTFYETIQDAINAANPGETVYLTEGTFTIPSYMSTPNPLRPHDPNTVVGMVLRPGVTLKGAGANKTTINFQNAFYGLVDANNAAVEGINLENSSTYSMRATVLLESSTSRIHNCTIRGGYDGLHIGFDSSSPATNAVISNNLIINNQQGIFITPNSSNISILNNTIAYNSYGGVSVQDGSTTTLRNNIIAFGGYYGVAAWATTAITMGNNDVYPNVAGAGYNSGITDKTGINGNISANPLFVDAPARNYQLAAGSPAVNSGTNIGMPFSGSAPDMGAFEQNAMGSIQLNSNQIGGAFVISGPQGNTSGSGISWSGTNLPSGIYTISFSSLPSLYSPSYQSVELLSGQALVINANYSADTTPPVGSIAINFEEYATDDANASIVLDITDAVAGMGPGAQMKFSNDGVTWSTPEPYSTLKTGWNLAAGYGASTAPGVKTVYAMASDALGNWATFTDTILYVPNRQVLNVPAQFSTIQAAVNAAQPGDVVQIAPGNFTENVILHDGVTLRGSGRERTLFPGFSSITMAPNSQIEGTGGFIVVYANAGPTVIQNNIFTNGWRQIQVTGVGRRIIRNNIFHPTGVTPSSIGVAVFGDSGGAEVVVENNSFSNLDQALYLQNAQPTSKVISRNNIFASNNMGVIDQSPNDSVHQHVHSSFNTYWANILGNFGELSSSYHSYYKLMEAGDVDANPLFMNVSTADFHLQAASTSINSGNPDARYADIDLSRNDRGAYGGQRAAIDSAPSFVTEPQSQFVTIGTNITLIAKAIGSLPLAYQWSKDGKAISAATTSTLTLNNVTISDVGVYTVSVTNQLGSVTSGPAYVAPSSSGAVSSYLLNVTAVNGLVSVAPGLASYPEGSFVTLTAASRPGYQFVEWAGDAVGIDTQLTVIMNRNKSITANYLITVPGAPTTITATGGNAQATVNFTAPASTGGSAITGYTVASSPAGGVDTNAGTMALTHTITGLSNGTAYTFIVTVTNSAGVSAASVASNSVTPSYSIAATLSPTASSMVSSAGGTGTVSVTTASGNAWTASSNASWITITSGASGNGNDTVAYSVLANTEATSRSGTLTVAGQSFTVTQATSAGLAVFADNFDGALLQSAYWIRGGAGAVDISGGVANFACFANADTIGKYHFSGDPIVVEARMVGSGASRDTAVYLVDVNTPANNVQAGDTNYQGMGLYTVGAGAFNTTVQAGNGNSVSTFKEYRLTLAGTSFTIERGDTLANITETRTVTLPNSVAGRTFFLRIGGAGTPYCPATYDWIRVISTTGNLITPTSPDAPTNVVGTAGAATATVSFMAPANTGTGPVTGYTVTSSPTGGVDSNAGTTALIHNITGLTNGTAYTFTVTATNSAGTSIASASSNSVTPLGVQTISFGASPTVVVGGTGTVSATGGASGNAVTFTSTTTSICTVSGTNGSTVTGIAVGICVIAANQAGSTSYAAADTMSQSFAVGKASGSNICELQPSPGKDTHYGTLYRTTGMPNADFMSVSGWGDQYLSFIEFDISTMPAAMNLVSAEIWLHTTAADGVAIGGNDAVTKVYQVTQPWIAANVSLGSHPTSVLYGSAPPQPAAGGWYRIDVTQLYRDWKSGTTPNYGIELIPTVTSNNNGTSFYTSEYADATLRPKIVVTVSDGSCSGAATPTVADAPTNAVAVAGDGQAVVSFVAPSSNGGSAITGYTVTSSPAGGADSNAGTTALTHTITGLANGTAYTFTVTATNSTGTGAASVSSNSVTPLGGQSITFGVAPTVVVGGTGTVSATGGASGNAVSFSSTTPTVCGVSGSTVSGLAAGACTIAANQVGNANYAAAPQVTQTITIDPGSAKTLSFAQGWNLLGNSLNQAFSVAPVFGDAAIVTTVWKWDVVTSGWQFYTPSLTPAALQTYAAGKGYGVLSVINPGEGYWVNAKVAASLGAQAGLAFTLTSANLVSGWNLVATGNDILPSAFNLSLSDTPPSPGVVPINLTTIWAWDNNLSRWYFYAPSLEASGALATYIVGKNYLDFTQYGKKLGNGAGFWVNKP